MLDHLRVPGALLCAALLAPGCSRETGPRQIPPSRTYKPVSEYEIQAVDSATRFGYRSREEGTAPAFTCDVPDGWEQMAPTQMRVLNFQVGPAEGGGECYLTILHGGGGQTAENVNRWRGQMGLEAASAADIEALPRKKLLGQDALYIDISGTFRPMMGESQPNWRMLGLLLELGENAVSLKMVGPADLVAKELQRFGQVASTMRAARGHGDSSSPPPPGGGRSDQPLAWTAPQSWQEGPPRKYVLVSFQPQESKGAECTVSILPGMAGGEIANIVRWYDQMGHAPPNAETINALPTTPIMQHKGKLIELQGPYTTMAGARHEDYAMIGTMCSFGDGMVFVKMTGPRAAVEAERQRFLDFCQSLRES